MSRACVVWVTATVVGFAAVLLLLEIQTAGSLWLNTKSAFAFVGVLSAVTATLWCWLRDEPDTEPELLAEYDPQLTRMCPNEHCRTVVVDQPTTRCPSCWTELS